MESEASLLKKKIAELEKALDRKITEMSAIQHIGKSLSSELNTERLLLLIMDEVTRLMHAERSTFYIVDNERGELWSKIAQKAEIREIRLKIGVGIAGHVAKTGEVINIEDAYNDPRFDPTTDKKTGYRTRSILCMPIFEPKQDGKNKPEIIGVLQILNKIDGVFEAADEELLSSLASQIAIAIINARLYTALEKRVAELNLMFDIESEIHKAYDLNELLEIFIDKIKETLHVEAAQISLLDEQQGKIVKRVARNLNVDALNKTDVSIDDGIPGEVRRSKEIYVNNNGPGDALIESGFEKTAGITVRHHLAAPLVAGDQVIGILEFFNKAEENEFFREDDVRLIRSLSSQISRSIEAFRLRDEKMKADRLASIGNMMSTIVHDLRTPMNNIYGFVDLLKEEEDPEVRQEYGDIIIEQIKTLNNMTRDILDFAKGKTTILPVKYPVDKLINNFSKVFGEDIRKRGYDFEAVCNAQANIYVDPEKITRVFMNIMKNALEAMDKGGKFSIVANQLNGDIEFLLSDTGSGIPPEIKDKLFESFVTSGKEGGTGLGLAIVKKLVEEHKGRIEVDSQPGKGTTFKLYFKKL